MGENEIIEWVGRNVEKPTISTDTGLDSARQKDHDDIVFLLRQKELVSRPQIKEKILATAGEDAWLATLPNFRRLCNLANGKVDEPDKYYEEG